MNPEEPIRSALKRLLLTPDKFDYLRTTRVLFDKPDGRERLPQRPEPEPNEAA